VALGYLQERGLVHPELIDRFRVGYANRTLGYRLPAKNRKEGAELRGRLAGLGILRVSSWPRPLRGAQTRQRPPGRLRRCSRPPPARRVL
jgi:hypothetical protein